MSNLRVPWSTVRVESMYLATTSRPPVSPTYRVPAASPLRPFSLARHSYGGTARDYRLNLSGKRISEFARNASAAFSESSVRPLRDKVAPLRLAKASA